MQSVWVIHCEDMDILCVTDSLEVAKATINQTYSTMPECKVVYTQKKPHRVDVSVEHPAETFKFRISNLDVNKVADHL